MLLMAAEALVWRKMRNQAAGLMPVRARRPACSLVFHRKPLVRQTTASAAGALSRVLREELRALLG